MPTGGGNMKYIITIALLATLALGYTYHGAYLLDGPIKSTNAAAFGMGGLRVLPPEGSANVLWAPSALPQSGIHAGLDLALTHASENRAMPLYDSFDDRIGWMPYVSIVRTYADFSITAVYGFEGEWVPSVAAGYVPVYDARYIYREQVRAGEGSAQDMLLGVWSIDSDGGLAGPVIGISEPIMQYATIGISATMLSGTIEMHRSPTAADSITHNAEPWEAPFDQDTVYSAVLSGTMINASVIITPTDRWQIGVRYVPKIAFGDSVENIDGETVENLYMNSMPSRFGIAVGYRPSGYVMSRIVVEAEMIGYGVLAEEDTAFGVLTDAWEFRLGLEHLLTNSIPMRIGAFYNKIPLADPITKTGFTIGSGVGFGPAMVDLSAGYEMSRYEWHDQFPESWIGSTGGDREENDRVEEGILIGSISVKVEF